MIIFLKVTKEEKETLLLRYSSVKFFLEKTISNKVDEIIAGGNLEKELQEYHNRKVLNNYDIHKRKHTQETKDKISNTLKEKYQGTEHHLFEETKVLIGLGNKDKVLSQETKDAIGRGNKGKKRSLEQRENISKAKTGQKYKRRVKESEKKVACLT